MKKDKIISKIASKINIHPRRTKLGKNQRARFEARWGIKPEDL